MQIMKKCSYSQLGGLVKVSNLGVNSSDVVQSPGRGFWEFTDNHTNQAPFEIIVWKLARLMIV